jgi:threonine dehydrogenase-like Zn-dependent dehydrogenase
VSRSDYQNHDSTIGPVLCSHTRQAQVNPEVTMRALVWRGGRNLAVEEVPDPEPRADEVVLEVGLAGICGSDLHPFKGHHGPRRPPLVLGHEVVGTVRDLPGRYSVFPLAVCGECEECRNGRENLCPSRQLLGLHRAGVFADRVAVPRDGLLEVPDGLSDTLAALVEPLAVCVSALAPADVGHGSRVLVMGCGTIGLLSVHLAAERGADVVAVDPVPSRREAASRMGATSVMADAAEADGLGAHLAMDAVGAESTWRGAVAGTRTGGEIVILGLAQGDGGMPVADLVRRSLRLRGHFAYTRAEFAEALALLSEDRIATDWLRVEPLEDGLAAFSHLADTPDEIAKILLRPGA